MHNQSHRQQRVAELLKRELAFLIQRELNDPRVYGVTLTEVELTRDLSTARIYFACPGGADDARREAAALNKAAGFLRRQLRSRLVLRGVPDLRFCYDESIEKGAALSSLIDRAVAEDRNHKPD